MKTYKSDKYKTKTLLAALTLTSLLALYSTTILVVADPQLQLIINTDKLTYNVSESVKIQCSLTYDGSPVTDGLIAIEIYSPLNSPSQPRRYAIRTIRTGTTQQPYLVEILDAYPCDTYGNPKTIFNKGEMLFLNITWKNNHIAPKQYRLSAYILYSNKEPMIAFYIDNGTIDSGRTISLTAQICEIPSSAPSGGAIVYVNLFTDYPKDGGYPYCPEKTTTFYIQNQAIPPPQQDPPLTMEFKIPATYTKLGTYLVYGTSSYIGEIDMDSTSFDVILVGDIDKDLIVNMKDISLVCYSFLSYPGHSRWNPDADLYPDNLINMRDISVVCKNFLHSGL